MTSAWRDERAPGLGQPHAARVAVDEHGAGLALERRDLLRDSRLRVGQRLGRGGEGAAQRDLPEHPQSLDVEH